MSVIFNGTSISNFKQVFFNGTAIDTIYFNGTKVYGTDGSWVTMYSNSLAPDSVNLENQIVPYFQSLGTGAGTPFVSQGYIQGPGQDSRYQVVLQPYYRVTSSDGTFYDGVNIVFYEGRTVTGINTSHNGSTSFSLQVAGFV
ncbi:MAG: hypothetical protein EBR82_42360 [Caulobacteraceae bacterium]|nr:hypothetical protein [Caulobacteraceae bacterium]